ncbi:hypothetical protein SERLA73DRAFT_133460 [Serpula lacrymans var. lacrymans S7.3]|uniref:Uncharacterized protein n=1 Tax=Serpula lacrymans var. lacrymans (strain S7.3) TaxID=936435 RepID=F8PTL0_SERL3|nr:hypothetical protein SERLA73DRAFT_133460 [Serpula lacrymans var. lacrymans S7.3]
MSSSVVFIFEQCTPGKVIERRFRSPKAREHHHMARQNISLTPTSPHSILAPA